MFLKILRTLEALATHVASVGFERNVDTNMAGNVVPFDCFGIAVSPGTCQTEVVGGFAADMGLAQMILQSVTATNYYT
jgi:hypothetical protein